MHRSRRVLPDEREMIEKILRHLGLWEEGVRVQTGTDPPGEPTAEPWHASKPHLREKAPRPAVRGQRGRT